MPFTDGYDKVAHLYDFFDTKPNIDFFLHYAVEAGEALDIGAGTGRIAIPIAERGIGVVCVEPSAGMRRVFSATLRQDPDIGSRITLLAGDAVTFKIGRTFRCAFMSGVFDHLADAAERRGALSNIAEHLVAGGRLVFDVFIGLMTDKACEPAGEVAGGDMVYRRFIQREALSPTLMKLTLAYETRQAGRLVERIEQESFAGIVDRAEVHDVLRATGFQVEREFSNYDFTPYEPGSDLLIVEARRL
jgi:SAM-dependent methyltransferase